MVVISFLVSLLALPVFLVCSVILIFRTRSAGGRKRWHLLVQRGPLALIAVLAISGTNLLYTYAAMQYAVILFPEDACRDGSIDSGSAAPVSHSDLPLSLVCPGGDSPPSEMVPAWINPTLLALSVIGIMAVLAALTSPMWNKSRASH